MFGDLDRERRRIEGALHDTVQQDLIAASVALQLAVSLLDTEPNAARELLEELEQQVQAALERVRALAHEIYPSILPAAGLGEALRALDVEVDTLDRYPLELEETLYFACRALLDGATRARIWGEKGAVCFEVEGTFDDVDIAHARERVTDAGGQLTVSAGGAAVTAAVPASPSAR